MGEGRKEEGKGGKRMILALATFLRLRFIEQSDYFRTACLPANLLTSSLSCQCTSKRKQIPSNDLQFIIRQERVIRHASIILVELIVGGPGTLMP